jgi:hypothetical protein
MTKNQLINYLVDCNGYSEDQDLEGLNKEELEDLVTDWNECQQYNN